jgi:glyoxylase-like metal-dependent hydrolase (beta-lactamase superfamily II)
MGNHLCFRWGDAVFTGDHVMGWASSLVSAPDGDLTDFMSSCAKLKSIAAQTYYPAHGAPVTDPAARLNWLIDHRKARENQILNHLQASHYTPHELTQLIYTSTPASLLLAAERNVFAHLVDLHERGEVTTQNSLSATAIFTKTTPQKSFSETM